MLLFWERVDHILKKKKLTLSWLSQDTKLRINTLKGWRQKNLHPRLNEAELIARSLDVTIDYLQTGRVLDTIDDPDLEQIIEFLRTLSTKELMFAKGMLSVLRSSPMRPVESREREPNGKATG